VGNRRRSGSAAHPADDQRAGKHQEDDRQDHEQHDHPNAADDRGEDLLETELGDQDHEDDEGEQRHGRVLQAALAKRFLTPFLPRG
jgi:hypothetical protein